MPFSITGFFDAHKLRFRHQQTSTTAQRLEWLRRWVEQQPKRPLLRDALAAVRAEFGVGLASSSAHGVISESVT